MPGNQMIGLPAIGLTIPGLQMLGGSGQRLILQAHVVLDLGCTRSIGSRSAIERFKKQAWYDGITTEFCRDNKLFVFANSATETCIESCIMHFPTTPPCSTTVDVLETGDVPILFSLSQMKYLGTTIELDPKGDKMICPIFFSVFLSSRLLQNGTYCVGLDEPCVPVNDQVA